MRDILFRGKRIDDGKWVCGYVLDNGMVDSKRIFVGGLVVSDATWNTDDRYKVGIAFEEVDPTTIGQFTGLYDKNNVKIFEGDIVKCWYTHEDEENLSNSCLGVIEYGKFNCSCCYGIYGFWLRPLDDEGEADIRFCEELGDDIPCRVIGNIYDNPEFLGGD